MALPSLCGVLEARRPQKLPKQHRILLPREDGRFMGAGFVPFTLADPSNPGQPSLLLSRHHGQAHFHDFGGDKSSPEETVVECATRHLTEETFGLLALDFNPIDVNSTIDVLKEIHFSGGARLLSRCSSKWIACQLVNQHAFSCHFNEKSDYAVSLIPIEYIATDLLNAASDALEGGRRRYYWIPFSDIRETPLIPRLAITSLLHAQVPHSQGEPPEHDCVILP